MASGSHRPDLSALLRAQRAVVDALAEGASGADALSDVLATVAGALGWRAAAAWEPTSDRLSALAARALAGGRPVWDPDGAVCFPLLGRQGPVGALELVAPTPGEPDAEVLATLASLGVLIGRALERWRTEAELRRSDAFLRATLNAAFDAVVAMDAQGTIVAVNPAAEALFGRSADELVGRELAGAIVPPALREAHRRGLADYIAGGAARVLGHPLELSALRADGSEFPVEVAIRRLDVPGPPLFTGFIRDLTATRAAEAKLRLFAREQAALRHVATLVARGADQAAVFAVVTEEVARLSGAQTANMIRYRADDTALVIGAWSAGGAANIPVGAQVPLDGDSIGPRIRRAGRPMRIDAFVPGEGELDDALRRLGFTAAIGTPITVDGELWGALILRSATPFPPGAEDRLHAFAELAAQALANAEAREQLAASRARLVTAGMEERRRLERNLHDGAQQRLVSLALLLRLASRHVADAPDEARRELALASDELDQALAELREIARGLHPAVLSDHGLEAAVRSLCDRAPLPVDFEIELPRRPAEAVQAAAYYVVGEALTNVARYARATCAAVRLHAEGDRLAVEVTDDGVGGADRRLGSGLSGLADRVEALGGRLAIESPPDRGTRIHAELPL